MVYKIIFEERTIFDDEFEELDNYEVIGFLDIHIDEDGHTELSEELNKAEEKYNLINKNLKEIQEKFSILRENKARSEATLEGIEKRKKDFLHSDSCQG